MNLEIEFCGLTLANPLMPAAGPLTGDAAKMAAIARLGVGAIVTKTISSTAAEVERPCIVGFGQTVYNTEKWSEHPPERWIGEFLPSARAAFTQPLVVSCGYTQADMERLIPQLDPFADAFEISTHYVGSDLSAIGRTLRAIRARTEKPVFMKISPHLPDPDGFARMVAEEGGNGIVAINSVGPALTVDTARHRLRIGDRDGHCWASGPSILPIALAAVRRMKETAPGLTILAAGGVRTADDIVAFLMAGASAVQMLSGALLYGRDLYSRLLSDLPAALAHAGFDSAAACAGGRLPAASARTETGLPVVDWHRCTHCGLCERICPWFAMHCGAMVETNPEACFRCGLCESRCPAAAISGVLSPAAQGGDRA